MAQKIVDSIDRRILHALVSDGRISNNELADRAGISPSPCLRRVRRMEEVGIIRGYTALVDPIIDGFTMAAFVIVRLNRQHEEDIKMFEEAVCSWDDVLECHLVAGSPDYILKVMSASLESYERFIKDRIATLKCVSAIETCFVMNSIKQRRS